ncbi:PREDICTED: uncharacterized protein LOC109361821 [Lupinus angustifolius]|uniref:uncharacterized protein LOC109361821 n=1 Tax=Lupinus angustifolius TaxID=3871 RepID=UPI00092EB519|nr:PREDICTED: uncharacterized protein LOC109361821 [Lupinus angustifolius]
MANIVGIMNSLTDPFSPYYLHPDESPGCSLVKEHLSGANYHLWSRDMLMALKPNPNDPNFGTWDRCNTLVMSWINHSLDHDIVQSVLWLENAYDIWKNLKERSYREEDYVVIFLKGINEKYLGVRSQIMLMDPLPNINKAFSLLMQQERQFALSSNEPRIFNSTSDNSTGRGRYRGRALRGAGRSSRIGNMRGKVSNSKVCTFCNKVGHTIDVCYKKHGFPPHYKFSSNVNNISSSVDNDTTNTLTEEEHLIGFTPAQHKAILVILKEPTNHSNNQINTISLADSG